MTLLAVPHRPMTFSVAANGSGVARDGEDHREPERRGRPYDNGFLTPSEEMRTFIEETCLVKSEPLENYCTEILDDLRLVYARREDAIQLPEITVYICDENGLAGGIPAHSAIVIDKAAFDIATDKGELAWLIAHEFSHFVYRWKNMSDPISRNTSEASVPEESYCDLEGQVLAIEAGYSGDGGVRLLTKLRTLDESRSSRWDKLFKIISSFGDPHLDFDSRIIALEKDFKGAQRLTTGTSSPLEAVCFDDPVAEDVRVVAKKVTHTSFFSAMCTRYGYEDFPLSKKVNFIQHFYPHVSNFARSGRFDTLVQELAGLVARQRSAVTARASDREKGGNKLVLERMNERGERLFDAILDTFARYPNGPHRHKMWIVGQPLAELCQALLGVPKGSRIIPEIGRARAAYETFRKFNSATSLDEAREAARAVKEVESLREAIANTFFAHVGLSESFSRFDDKGLRTPGNIGPESQLCRWMIEDTTGTLLNFGVSRLGVDRNGLYDSFSLNALDELHNRLPDSSEDWTKTSLQTYINNRRSMEACRTYPNEDLLKADSATWIRTFAVYLDAVPPYYDKERLPIGHPFKDISESAAEKLHRESWTLLCNEWRRRVERGEVVEEWRDLQNISYGTREPWRGHPLLDYCKEQVSRLSRCERLLLVTPLFSLPLPAHVFQSIREAVPQTAAELRRFYDEVGEAKTLEGEKYQRCALGLTGLVSTLCSEMLKRDRYGDEKARFEAIRLIYELTPDAATPLLPFAESCAPVIFSMLESTSPEVRRGLLELYPRDLIALYQEFNSSLRFPTSTARREFGNVVAEAIERESDPSERIKLFAELLSEQRVGTLNARNFITDVPLKNRLTRALGESFREFLGARDSGEEKYFFRIVEKLYGQHFSFSPGTRWQIMSEIARSTQAQAKLSFWLEERARLSEHEKLAATVPTKGIELVIQESRKDPAKRRVFIDFLTSDGGRQACDKLYDELKTWACDYLDDDRRGWGRRSLASSRVVDTLITNEYRNEGDCPITRDLHYASESAQRELGIMAIADMYAHLADLPQNVQAVILRGVLVPPKDECERGDQAMWDGCSIILDKLFPIESLTPDTEAHRDATWARELILTLIEVSHDSERNLLIGALAAGARLQEGSGEVHSTGRTLRRLLPLFGPAFIKLGQALHSSKKTPESIRVELADLKGNVDEMVRWEMWHYVLSLMAGEKPDDIPEILELSGSASYNFVYFAQSLLGEREALGFLRKHAAALATKGYKTMRDVSSRAHCIQEFREDLLAIIEHAEELGTVEVDTELGARQNAIQCAQFGGVQVIVKETPFNFVPRRWKKWGDGWRRMEAVSGVTFDKLPESTQREQEFKTSVAEAILVAELTNIARGEQVDYNRTERNCHIDGTTIYPIDAGGMSIHAPSDGERDRLGRLFADLVSGKPLWDAYKDRQGAPPSPFFKRLEQALFYLGFAFDRIPPERYKGVFLAVLASGEVHPRVREAMYDELGADSVSLRVLSNRYIHNLRSWWSGGCVYRRKAAPGV